MSLDGPPALVREIREAGARTPRGQLPRYDWVIAHAWSSFRLSPGTDEDAENSYIPSLCTCIVPGGSWWPVVPFLEVLRSPGSGAATEGSR
jgi:hypothetical protein